MSRIAINIAAAALVIGAASTPAFAMSDRDSALDVAIAHQMEVTSYFGAHRTAATVATTRAPASSDDYIALSVQREKQFGSSFLR